MSEMLSQRQAALKLGVTPSRIKQLWAEHVLLKVMIDRQPHVPADCIAKGPNGWVPLESVRGTMTMLLDAGFSAEEATDWMLSEQDGLESPPLELLAKNRVREVRNAILPLAF
ncbi:MAG: Rv2175c family DNA-binding protein [Actinomycetaceae bacterium]|nr:Rv2175c family DNA-binding protein [Actinomycetaceae bacterium]